MRRIAVHSIGFFPRMARISLAVFLCWPGCAWCAQAIVGTVVNGTMGKPSAGDDIALLTVVGGSLEVSRGKTANDGSFHLATDTSGKHILRVRHDGVIYQQELTSGIAPTLKVFDSSTELAGISEAVTVMKIEPAGQWLSVTELHSIVNESKPPRTLANDDNLKILLPAKATLDAVVVQGPSWHPEKVKPKPVGHGSHQFAAGFPLRPGTTQFAIKYRLPYSESATISPHLQYSSKLWTVMFPKSMSFTPLHKSSFHRFMEQEGMRVQAIAKVPAGEVPAFVISGGMPAKPAQLSSGEAPADLLQILSAPPISPSVTLVHPRIPAAGSNRAMLYLGIIGIVLILGVSFLSRTRQPWSKVKSFVE
ncbi:MAG: hypothetical protein WAL56_13510 [Candidatus Sulfotelmatobacter sp.]